MEYYDDDSMEEEEDDSYYDGWIKWFCRLKGHDFLLCVEDEFIRDSFNLYGLRQQAKLYNEAMKMILSEKAPDQTDFERSEFQEVYGAAIDLYSLIHSRYIISPQGLEDAREMYMLGKFGTCPRMHCKRHPVIPYGASSDLNISRVKVFCPLCKDVYIPRKGPIEIDGAAFGPSFPQTLLLSFPELIVKEGPYSYFPKLYGFKIFGMKGSKYQIKFDENGMPTNKDNGDKICKEKRTDEYD